VDAGKTGSVNRAKSDYRIALNLFLDRFRQIGGDHRLRSRIDGLVSIVIKLAARYYLARHAGNGLVISKDRYLDLAADVLALDYDAAIIASRIVDRGSKLSGITCF